MNTLFQAKRAKCSNCHIIETTSSIVTKFCTVIKTTKHSLRVVQISPKQIQGGERSPSWKIEKLRYLKNILTDFDEIWYTNAYWPYQPKGPKNHNLKIQNGERPPFWKFEKLLYLHTELTLTRWCISIIRSPSISAFSGIIFTASMSWSSLMFGSQQQKVIDARASTSEESDWERACVQTDNVLNVLCKNGWFSRDAVNWRNTRVGPGNLWLSSGVPDRIDRQRLIDAWRLSPDTSNTM